MRCVSRYSFSFCSAPPKSKHSSGLVTDSEASWFPKPGGHLAICFLLELSFLENLAWPCWKGRSELVWKSKPRKYGSTSVRNTAFTALSGHRNKTKAILEHGKSKPDLGRENSAKTWPNSPSVWPQDELYSALLWLRELSVCGRTKVVWLHISKIWKKTLLY